jgi:hypothetical protein
VEEALKVFIPFLFFLVVLLSLQAIEYLRRRSARRRGRQAMEGPATAPVSVRFRFPPRPASPGGEPAPPPGSQVPAPPLRAEPAAPAAAPASREGARRAPPVGATAPMPSGLSARVRIRGLLREPRGRRVAILARDILGSPPGLEGSIAGPNVPEVERV